MKTTEELLLKLEDGLFDGTSGYESITIREIISKIMRKEQIVDPYLENYYSKIYLEMLLDTNMKSDIKNKLLDIRIKLDSSIISRPLLSFEERDEKIQRIKKQIEQTHSEKLKEILNEEIDKIERGYNGKFEYVFGRYIHSKRTIILYYEAIKQVNYSWLLVLAHEMFHAYHAHKTKYMENNFDIIDAPVAKESLASYHEYYIALKYGYNYLADELKKEWEDNSIENWPYSGASGIYNKIEFYNNRYSTDDNYVFDKLFELSCKDISLAEKVIKESYLLYNLQ